MPPSPFAKVRKLCLALPEAHEVEAWGAPTFRVRNKIFATFADATSHHHPGRPAAWVKAAEGDQSLMVKAQPSRFFVPPYLGKSGWVGMWLDRKPDWATLAALLESGYRLVASQRQIRLLDDE